jgi:hypothetical protein
MTGPDGYVQQQPPPSTSIRDAIAQARGVDLSGFGSDDELLAYIEAMAQQAQQIPVLERLAAFGQRVMPYASQFEEWLQSQGATPEQAAQIAATQQQAHPQHPGTGQQPAPAPYWSAPPDWNPEWEKYLALDDRGNVVVPQQYLGAVDAGLPQKYLAYRRWQQEQQQKLLADPVGAIWDGIEQRLEARDRERGVLTQRDLEDYRARQFANSFAMANRDWLYVTDPQTGQPATNPAGQPQLSEAGQYYAVQVQRLERSGITDPQAQAQMALEMTYPLIQLRQQQQLIEQMYGIMMQAGLIRSPQQQQPGRPFQGYPLQQDYSPQQGYPPQQPGYAPGQPNQSPPPPQAIDPRQRFLDGNGYSPNRSGTIAQSALPSAPQNPNLSYRALLHARARDQGMNIDI